jgi:hypothetical protein
MSVKSTLGQNCQMFVSMRTKTTSWDKTAIFLSVWRLKNQRTNLSIYILDTIESESTTRFKNRSSDRMMMSDWLVDVSDDRYTTTGSRRISPSIAVFFLAILFLTKIDRYFSGTSCTCFGIVFSLVPYLMVCALARFSDLKRETSHYSI